jgi:hypothetical protein
MYCGRRAGEAMVHGKYSTKKKTCSDQPSTTNLVTQQIPFSFEQSKDIAILRASYQEEQLCEEGRTVKDFVHSFLAQQNEQQQLGIDDPRGLFQFSKACSKHSRKRALLQAQDNARESFWTKEDLADSIDQVFGMISTESFVTC